ncbi:ABC transporter permease subunit [Bartonella sp. HY761]|uniref:ABC transporter permease subunit n=1 Tax=Bartonella sp. HY761 TaxID=2979330 RepID=UPI0021FA9E7A|nr:ABC transporter permease subunit [Bartonella sp. HY761]UXN05973.1 ABC transporter permease subunit [Bartonella sp. HY761]
MTANQTQTVTASAFSEFWYSFKYNRGSLIGLIIFFTIVLLSVLAPLIAPYGYQDQFRDFMLKPPVWQNGGSWQFILGTDAVGRDILSRILHGARFTLLVGVIVALIAMIFGIILGVIAGYIKGPLDAFIMRIMDIILTIPSLLLALVLITIIGYGLKGAVIATAIALQPHFVRLARAAVIAEKNKEYVVAAKLAGAGPIRLMFKTILPNCMAPLIVQATFSFSTAILDVAALGFLGMGAQAPLPEWGTMLADAREFVSSAWWVVTFPGLAILILVLSINLMGDGLRDALDPKLKRS